MTWQLCLSCHSKLWMKMKNIDQHSVYFWMNSSKSDSLPLLLKTKMLQKSKVQSRLIPQEVICYCEIGNGCIHGYLCLTLLWAATNTDVRYTLPPNSITRTNTHTRAKNDLIVMSFETPPVRHVCLEPEATCRLEGPKRKYTKHTVLHTTQ